MDTGPGAVVGRGAVFVPLVHDVVQANIIISDVIKKLEQTRNSLQFTQNLLQPYLGDLNIMSQRHGYIDAPLVIEAKEGLEKANSMLEMATSKVYELYAMVASNKSWTRHGVSTLNCDICHMLNLTKAVNLDNLTLFHAIDGPNIRSTRAEFGNRFNGSHANTWR